MRHALMTAVVFLVGSTGLWVTANAQQKYVDEFESKNDSLWQSEAFSDGWTIDDGMLSRHGTGDSLCRAAISPVADLVVDTRLRLIGGSRKTFGIAMRVDGDTYLLLRYYDQPQALEVLSYKYGSLTPIRQRSEPIDVQRDKWYRLRVACVDGFLWAKLWPGDQGEPDWQLQVEVPNRSAGTFALVTHDDTQVEFDWVRATGEDEFIKTAKAEIEAAELRRKAELQANLKLAVVPEAFPDPARDETTRSVCIVPYAETDRCPVAGELTIECAGHKQSRRVELQDYHQMGLEVEVATPQTPADVHVSFATDIGTVLEGQCTIEPVSLQPWRRYVQTCLNTLIEHGRDEYGPLHTPLFMTLLDADTLQSPEHPMRLDALVRLEDRLHRRGERGSNLWYDQPLIKCLDRMTEITGDDRYAEAADEYISYFFEHCHKDVDPEHEYLNGMPAWGTHVFWDCYDERPAGDGDGNGPHEILVLDADWQAMYDEKPEDVRRTIEGIWRYHIVDKSSGLHNRHDNGAPGCDFAFSGSSFAQAMAFMYQKTGEQRYLDRAKTIVNWHWDNRNIETYLTADAPGVTARYDGHHCFTTVVGPHALGLLECYRLTGDPHFLKVALSYIKAYDRYGWDEEQESYWAMIALDGAPVPEQQKGRGYDAYAPYGHIDVWRTTIYSYEFSLAAAQAAVAAYETTVRDGRPDASLLQLARRWGSVVERALPPKSGRRWKADLEAAMPKAKEIEGAYAEDYGRAISLFVHLHHATGEQHYLDLANEVAEEAVEKLFHNGLFVGHPAKPYYETTNGVGLLLLALMELDAPNAELGGAW